MTHWQHKTNGRIYYSFDARPIPQTLEQYKAMIRRAYGSLRGVTIREFKQEHRNG